MNRMLLSVAAVAAVVIGFSATASVQARMIDPGLNSAAPALVQDVQYWRHRRSWRSRHYVLRHRQCWNERVRVRVRGGYHVWRTVRRCSWRTW